MPSRTCCNCTQSIISLQEPGKSNTSVQILFSLHCSHQHDFCAICFSEISAARGCDFFLSCHQCKEVEQVKTWNVEKVVTTKTSQAQFEEGRSSRSGKHKSRRVIIEKEEEATTILATHSISDPQLNSHPSEYHKNLCPELKNSTTILSVSIPSQESSCSSSDLNASGGILTIAAEMRGDDQDQPGRHQSRSSHNLEQIFQVLHLKILGENPDEAELNGIEQYGSIGKSSLDEFIKSKTTILFRCLYALATGNLLKHSQEGKKWDAQRAKVFAATDIIRNLARQSMGVLKKVVGRLLLANPVSKSVQNILNKFGVAPSNQYTRLKDFNSCYEKFLHGLGDIDPHDIYLVLFDNIGYRRKPGYEQFIAIQLLRIPKDDAKKVNLYQSDPSVPAAAQERKDWNEIKANTDYDEIIKADDEDILRFTKSILAPISLLLKLDSEHELPTTDECFELCKHGRDMDWPTTIPEELGARRVIEKDGTTPFQTVVAEVEEEDAIRGQEFANMYERNNVLVDRPMNKDLNSTRANLELMNYAKQLLQTVQSAPVKDVEQGWENIDKLSDHFGIGLLGDGNPVFIMNNLRKERQVEFKNLRAYFGGFHLILEIHRKRGSLFAGSHLEDVFSSWRATEGQLKWVMNPGDPRQINSELIMYMLALYVVAQRALVSMGRTEISAADVVNHINERAKDHPIVKCFVDEMRYAEIIFMLQEAEKKSDAQMFISALKLAIPLFAASHATKYVNMATSFLVDWHCMSEADKILFAEFIFTRKTAHGYSVFSDCFVELMMKDLRVWTGNVGTEHTGSHLETTCLNLVDRKKARAFGAFEVKSESAKRQTQQKKAGEAKVKELQIDHVFIETVIFATEANLFGNGAPKHIKKGAAAKFERGDRAISEYYDNEHSQICNPETKLNKEALRGRSIGVERSRAYFDHFFVAGEADETQRGEKEVKLTTIDPLMSEADKNSEKELERATTTDTRILEKFYTVQELKNESRALSDILDELEEYDEVRDPPSLRDQRKSDWCYYLKILRQDILRMDSLWESRTRDSILNDMNDRGRENDTNLKQALRDELKDPFFTLDRNEKAKQKVYSFAAAEEDNEFDNGSELQQEEEHDTNATRIVDRARESFGVSAMDISFTL